MTNAKWFIDNGVGVFPIKAGSKEPACRSWPAFDCTREWAERYEGNYGVRLSSTLGVIDTDDVLAEQWVREHCPDSPLKVRGARGVHRYYRLLRDTPKFIHRDGLTIEFRNAGQYVVGPGSTHPTGIIYEADPWSWIFKDIPIFPEFVFDDRPGAVHGRTPSAQVYEFPDSVAAGERHDALYKLLRQQKALGLDKESTWVLIQLANTNRCSPPLSDGGELRRWFDRGFDTADRDLDRLTPTFKDVKKMFPGVKV